MSSFVDKLISSLLPVLSEATTAGDSRLGPVSEMGSDKSRAARPSGTAPAAAERATAEGKAAEYDYMDEIPLGDDEDDDDDWHDIGRYDGFPFSPSPSPSIPLELFPNNNINFELFILSS
ncbi:hypothetical protein F5B18DRAFT_611027 [Nemania serpens]|nr:hypothetical protein F5B18DRAFT_611027 [Nemania serpens]